MIKNQYPTPAVNQVINFDALFQEFDGHNIYGLEYILDDLVSTSAENTSGKPVIDWFGLYS